MQDPQKRSAQPCANRLVKDLGAALVDGLEEGSKGFSVYDAAGIVNIAEAAIAVNLRKHAAFLLVRDDDLPPSTSGERSVWLAETCAQLTRKWGTLVAPTHSMTGAQSFWGTPSERGAVGIKLALLDRPLGLPEDAFIPG